jgi:hypothetical protein
VTTSGPPAISAACSTGCEPELDHASLLDGFFGRQEQQVVGDHGVPARLTDLRHER